jgi:DNA gyrase subunit B
MAYDDVTVLAFTEVVRRRPRVYFDDPHGLVLGIVENALDEAAAGYGDSVVVTLDGGTATIEDRGRGIPIENPTPSGTQQQRETFERRHGDASALELVFTMEPGQGRPDRIARGLGSSIVNGKHHSPSASLICALCTELIVETTRAGRRYRARFERGRCVEQPIDLGPTETIGTTITVRPDFELFGGIEVLDPGTIAAALRTAAEGRPNVDIQLRL